MQQARENERTFSVLDEADDGRHGDTALVVALLAADRGVPAAAEAFAARVGGTDRLRLVHAERHAVGMAASLKAGVESLDDGSEGAFVFLGDMPRIPAEVAGTLADAIAGGAPAAAPAFAGRRGHPVNTVGDLEGPCSVEVIRRDPATGMLSGGSDPRRDGWALAW